MNFNDVHSNMVPGYRIPIYAEIMNEEGLLGEAEIVEFIEDPNSEQTFIRKDMPSAKQEVWAPRKAIVRMTSVTEEGIGFKLILGEEYTREIAYPYRIGNTPSGWYSPVRHQNKNLPSHLVDSFIKVNGIEIY